MQNDSKYIKYEEFMEDINNILNAGDIPNIYTMEDMDTINKAMKLQMQGLGLAQTPANFLSVFVRHLIVSIARRIAFAVKSMKKGKIITQLSRRAWACDV
ncbi:hypothetical protein J437_LFUL011085 [Ladona fulva]|uniref:Dynein heavy chain AAA module D4 domain-containing protein n=1 Tax=Ladona fulva TaxID=123851 RepID=A0A8K0P1E3_LADFU|nr:hypothetical protein J437_LFUL011085 [Ladona fulva]